MLYVYVTLLSIPLSASVAAAFTLKLLLVFPVAVTVTVGAILSSIFVVSNALRLKFFRPILSTSAPTQQSCGTQINLTRKEDVMMKKTISIEGMMCPHCSGHVHDALCNLPGVQSAEVSHETGKAVCTLSGDVSDDLLVKAVSDAGYKVLEIS